MRRKYENSQDEQTSTLFETATWRRASTAIRRTALLFCFCFCLADAWCASGTPGAGPRLGLQSWTCRDLTFDQVVAFAIKHHIKWIEFTPRHLNPYAPHAETLRKKAILEQYGLVAYASGVNHCTMDMAKNRQLFEFARLMGMKLIVVEPFNPAAWNGLEKLVREYDIRLAIHNHNLHTSYGDPAAVRAVLAARDHRIGVCLDVGWITAAGFDAAEVFQSYGDRVYDIHLKDKARTVNSDGTVKYTPAEIGRGTTDYPALFTAIQRRHWSGVLAIEEDCQSLGVSPDQAVEDAKPYFAAHTAQ